MAALTLEEEQSAMFAISENIMSLLAGEEESSQKVEEKYKRERGNLLNKATKRLLDTLQKCNPHFNYLQLMNPRRDLTVPSEGVFNDGFDNVDGDYILRVGDPVVTPENRE